MTNKSHYNHYLNTQYTQAFLAGIILSFAMTIVDWVDRMYFEDANDPKSGDIRILVTFLILFVVGTFATTILKKLGFMGFRKNEASKLHQYILKFLCLVGGALLVPVTFAIAEIILT